jgi:hypothetical protein
MEIKLQIPAYSAASGFANHWEDGFEIKVTDSPNEILIQANKAGLISLAIQLLTLAQDEVPAHHHIHLDEYNSLEKGSKGLTIEKH